TLPLWPDLMTPRALALLLMLLPLASWAVQGRAYGASVGLLIGGCIVAILLVQIVYSASIAIVCLALVVGLAGFYLDKWAGLAVAAAATGIVLGLPEWGIVLPDGGVVPITLLSVWTMALFAWTATEPLQTLANWSWFHYDQARSYAQAVGDRQVELMEALEDLKTANTQLEYLNRIVHAAKAEADESRRAKVEFVANVSHELRTPLNMIIGFSEMVLDAPRVYGAYLPPALMADIAAIHRNGSHLQGLIDDVLDLSQIDMHRMAMVKEPVELQTLAEEAVEAVRYLYESKGLTLVVELPQALPTLLCDRTRIREVLLNLLSNAGRFTDAGGVVVRTQVEKARIVVSVADTGPGIAPEQMQKVFEPFQQLDSSIRRRFGGSGLGLTISRSFVEMHDGRMWIESEPGRGTTVFFDLPLPDIAAPDISGKELAGRSSEPRPRPRHRLAAISRPRMAVADESQMLQRLLLRYQPELDVVTVANVPQAVTQYQQHPFQAILANVLTSEQALALLARRGSLPPRVPLVVTSFPTTASGTKLLGVDQYLVKPITRTKLEAALSDLSNPVHTILLADDDMDAPQLFGRMLSLNETHHYRVLHASTGREALHLLRSRQPDLLLLDLVMPDIDGWQVLREKDADLTIREIPTFVISARDILEQPLMSNVLCATSREGLTVPDMLESIGELVRILGLP
ncbi:MAG: ATP-binding protein, partial [Anaerolineae bacterium]